MRRLVALILFLAFSLSAQAVTVVVDGRGAEKGHGKLSEEWALDDAHEQAVRLVMSQMTDEEALRVRGRLTKTRLKPHLSALIRRYHVISRSREGSSRVLRLSVEVDEHLLRDLLKREGFFRGRDVSRALILVSYSEEKEGQADAAPKEANVNEYGWWTEDRPLPREWAERAKPIEEEWARQFASKGYIFVKGASLGVMDLVPSPLRVLKPQEAQLKDLGRLLDVDLIVTGQVVFQQYAPGKPTMGRGEARLQLWSTESQKFVAQAVARNEFPGLAWAQASEEGSRKLAQAVADDLSQQLSDQWSSGQKSLPSVLVRVSAVPAAADYLRVRKILEQPQDLVAAVVEQEQAQGSVSFRVSLKGETEKFVQQARQWSSVGLEFQKYSPSTLPGVPASLEMRWVR